MRTETYTHVPERRFVKREVIQELLGIDRRTLWRLTADEGLPVVRITPYIHRYDLDAVYAWIDSRCSEHPAGSTDTETTADEAVDEAGGEAAA